MISDRQLMRMGLTREQYDSLLAQNEQLNAAEAKLHDFDNREDEDDDR